MESKTAPTPLSRALVYEVAARNYGPEGTLHELAADVDRIRGLGVDVLYLQPVYPISVAGRKGRDGSLYGIADYRAVRPELGGEAALRRVIDRAHAAGMRVAMDVVFNHAGCDSVLLTEHPEWALRDAAGKPTRKVDDWSDIYDLDFSQPGLREELTGVLHHWVDMGVDGFRCDVAAMVPLDFWLSARASFDDRDVFWIAETFTPEWIANLRRLGVTARADAEMCQAFDLLYDFDGYECMTACRSGKITLAEYLRYLTWQPLHLPAGATKLRFLENHDLPRIASVVTSPSGLRNWTLLDMLLPGATMISAGQEAALRVQASLFDKDPFPWADGDLDFERFVASIAPTVKQIKAVCSSFAVGELTPGVARLEWSGERQSYVAILNLEDRAGAIDVRTAIAGQELLTGRPISIDGAYELEKQPLLIRAAARH